MKSIIATFLILLSFLFSCSKDSGTNVKALTPEDLLIKDNEISGWERSGERWIASSNSDLATYINGEAVLYTAFGFVEAAKQGYEGKVLENTESIELRIFDQGKSVTSKALFDEIINQMSSPIDWADGTGEDAVIERFQLSQRIVFWNSKYFISLSITSGIDEALEVLKTFAKNVDSKI